ncbi:MAG: L-threonylcarbamoyladenylate synthase [Thermoleophilia bacterium]
MSGQRRVVLAELGPADGRNLIELLAGAELACFPTDTVYGIGGLLRPSVGRRIYDAKGRAADKPLQVIFPTVEALIGAVTMGERMLDAVRRLLPGGLTLLLPYPAGLGYPPPGRVEAAGRGRRGAEVETLGVRVPRWPEAAAVLGSLSLPLLASSANVSGARPARSLDEVEAAILAACDLLLDAGPVAGAPSTVVDLTSYEDVRRWRVLRPGAVSADQIREMLARRREDLPR